MIVFDYFGHVAYHVGSSLDRKDWRDVDVRVILPDGGLDWDGDWRDQTEQQFVRMLYRLRKDALTAGDERTIARLNAVKPPDEATLQVPLQDLASIR